MPFAFCFVGPWPSPALFTAPEVLIVDEQGLALYEKFYNLDSLLELVCIVNHITMSTSVVHWLHGDLSLNYDATRGGIRYVLFFAILAGRFVSIRRRHALQILY